MTSENPKINDPITAEILRCEERYLDAIRNSDIDHLDFLVHDDVLFIGLDGALVTKMMELEKYRSKSVEVHSLTTSEPIISAMGDTAIISVIHEFVGEIDSESVEHHQHYLRVWKKIADAWQIVAGSCTEVR